MTLDAARGRGHYRCGCGHRLHLTIPQEQGTRCVATHRDGPCRLRPVTTEPLPLCDEHFTSTGLRRYASWWTKPDGELARLIAYERDRLSLQAISDDQTFIDCWMRQAAEDDQRLERMRTDAGREFARRRADTDNEANGTVYFLRSGDSVKIGTTLNLARRAQQITVPNPQVLATEPGYRRRERLLHLTFSRHRLNGEWFDLAPALVTYINRLRTAARVRPIDVPAAHVDKIAPTL